MNNEQDQFYTAIAGHYSQIFPYQPMQLQYVKSKTGHLSGKHLLDVGCATGELANRLAEENAKVTGIDLNADLLRRAVQTRKSPDNPAFRLGNMLDIQTEFEPNSLDAVVCFGNTLVHLESQQQVGQMLLGVKEVLKNGGKLLLQILNYDYILDNCISELPVIESEEIKFIRKYRFSENGATIRFCTELYAKKDQQTMVNETTLLGLRSHELMELLNKAGFNEVELYSNFRQDAFGGKHLPLVVSAG